MEHPFYFWRDNQVHRIEIGSVQEIPAEWRNLFCVDASFSTPYERYGRWDETWVSIPFKHFPPEFRLQLLLLGVS